MLSQVLALEVYNHAKKLAPNDFGITSKAFRKMKNAADFVEIAMDAIFEAIWNTYSDKEPDYTVRV